MKSEYLRNLYLQYDFLSAGPIVAFAVASAVFAGAIFLAMLATKEKTAQLAKLPLQNDTKENDT